MDGFLLSSIILAVCIICIFIRPFNQKEWIYPLILAIVSLFLGLVSLDDIKYVFLNTWNAGLSLISIMIISILLDEIGFFRWAALTVVFTSEGSRVKLFINIIFLGSLISIFFNNDGAILILTPIIYEAMKSIGFSYKETIPFLFACGYIADTASVPLVVSNLANIVAVDTLSIGFSEYFSKMIIPGIVIIIAVSITMYINFKKELTGKFTQIKILNPDDEVKDWTLFNSGVLILFLVVCGYFIGSIYNIEVSIISSLGAIALYIHCKIRKTINLKGVFSKAPWSILIFVCSMYLIVYGLYNNGLNHVMEGVLQYLNTKSSIIISLIYGIISTITACFMNNLPSVMVGSIAIDNSNLLESTKEIISYANVIGSDVGAKITPIGSLATIMWLNILKQRGINISFKDYTITSLKVITIPLIIGLIVLALM
ncbi:MAG: ArsB/NhaD family transporter [Clostridium sp.]|uniref:ArsB/NhaD family transporter n=1 Tax=Clostridium sp. TaxID=1506 RepID=UPI002FCBA089